MVMKCENDDDNDDGTDLMVVAGEGNSRRVTMIFAISDVQQRWQCGSGWRE